MNDHLAGVLEQLVLHQNGVAFKKKLNGASYNGPSLSTRAQAMYYYLMDGVQK